jgi:hypothetical protein
MLSHTASVKTARTQIEEQLTRNIQNPNSFADAYIRIQDIRQAWSNDELTRHALRLSMLPSAEFQLIQDRLLRFISLLVYIGADDFLSDYRNHFYDRNGDLIYEDSKLPLIEQDIPTLGSRKLRHQFLVYQFLFVPVCDLIA